MSEWGLLQGSGVWKERGAEEEVRDACCSKNKVFTRSDTDGASCCFSIEVVMTSQAKFQELNSVELDPRTVSRKARSSNEV